MVSMIPDKKRFNGKIYQYTGRRYDQKITALSDAKNSRKKGFNSRVVSVETTDMFGRPKTTHVVYSHTPPRMSQRRRRKIWDFPKKKRGR